ncbi:acyl-CoA dehydrogenase family protein [uncultured Corynebacterium sp.]|uniref:acyl-CoA dehydrogenase family protein n=1 Tax=uncultured Corynebacterium sp. TaxID=159447 RepID=UPI0025DD1927|nr:acyl-CoA dehydrogenase family protein [uncultured Corynebacterium sp.]
MTTSTTSATDTTSTSTRDAVESAKTAIADVADTIRHEAVDRELNNLSPEPRVRELAAAGLGRLRVPTEFGGLGADVTDLAEVLVNLAAADSNFVQLLRGHLGFVEFLIDLETGHVRDTLLTAIGHGELVGPAASVPAAGQPGGPVADRIIDHSTTLTEQGGKTLLNGTKYYTTGSLYSDWISVVVVDENGAKEVVVRIDDPGVTAVDDWGGFGQRFTASGTTVFDDVEVRDGYAIPRTEPAIDTYLGAFYQFVHSATQAGIIRRVAEDLSDVVCQRHRTYPLATVPEPRHDPQVLEVVGEVDTARFAAAAAVEALARSFDAYNASHLQDDLDAVNIRSAQVQVINTRLAGEATWNLFNAASASATSVDLALDRHWRNVRTISSHNPVIYKARAVGDHVVNGTLPDVHHGFGAINRQN